MTFLSELWEKIAMAFRSGDGLLFRLIAFVVSSAFFTTYPFYLFGMYMAHHGFYAYEMQDNFFSLRIFFFAGFLVLALFGLFLVFSVPVVIFAYRQMRNREPAHNQRAVFWLALGQSLVTVLFNLVLVVAVVWTLVKKPDTNTIAPIIAAATLGILFMVVAFCRGRTYFATLSVVVVLAYLLPLTNTEGAARLTEVSLQNFNLGGVYCDLQTPEGPLEGKLVFLSPAFVYLHDEKKRRLSIIPRKDNIVVNFIRIDLKALPQ